MNRINRVVFVVSIAFLLFIALQPIAIHSYSRTVVDDGYYYLNYALNVANGAGPTFDGIVETNGVQPLWTVFLIVLATVFSDSVSLFYAALFLSIFLAVLSVICLNEALKRVFNPSLRGVTILLYILFIANPSLTLTGMELTTNLATLTLTLAVILHSQQITTSRLIVVGLFISLTVLARIDNLIVAPVFILLLLWHTGITEQVLKTYNVKAALRVTLMVMLSVIGIFLLYLAFNWMVFARLMPISGDVKAARETLNLAAAGGRFTLNHLWMTTAWTVSHYAILFNNFVAMVLASFGIATLLARFVFIMLVLSIFTMIILRRRQPAFRRQSSPEPIHFDRATRLTIILSVLIVFAHTWIIFLHLGKTMASTLSWYFAPEYVLMAVLFGGAIGLLAKLAYAGEQFYRRLSYVLVAMGIFSGVTFYLELVKPPEVRPLNTLYEMANWANENLPSDAVIGSFNSGMIGYFTDATVINLDGLMNDESILQVIRDEDTMAAYVDRMQIAYIMDYALADWSPETANSFREIPMTQLELMYEHPFTDWEYIESVYYIFRVTPQ